MSNESSNSGGIGFLGLLCIVFIVLKLTGYINWSWWWVTILIWGGAAIFIIGLLIFLLIALIKD